PPAAAAAARRSGAAASRCGPTWRRCRRGPRNFRNRSTRNPRSSLTRLRSAGRVNFPTQIYKTPPQLVDELAQSMLDHNVKPEIEVFDAAMLYNAKTLLDRGLLRAPPH